MASNSDVDLSLEEAVAEVLGMLTGLELEYQPSSDRFHAVARQLNRALRAVALESEWSYFSSTEEVGTAQTGVQDIELTPRLRLRVVYDDAVQLVDDAGVLKQLAYFLPRDALPKYRNKGGLWCTVTRSTIRFNRPLNAAEAGLHIRVPAMREPRMFDLPRAGTPFTTAQLAQKVDFDYPDLVVAKAAFMYAQADPIMQPRVMALEEQYKDLMYQLVERDDRFTDSPYMNGFIVPVHSSVQGPSYQQLGHDHPHTDTWAL